MRIFLVLLFLAPGCAMAAPPNLALDWNGTASGADFMRLTCGGNVHTDDPTPPVQLTDAAGDYVLAGAGDGVVCTLYGVNFFGPGPASQLFIGVPGASPTLTVITQ